MIKDFLVVLDDVGERAAPYAISLAKTFDAHLTGLCMAENASLEVLAMAEIRYDMIVDVVDRTVQRAALTTGRLVESARDAHVDAEGLAACGDLAETTAHLVSYARLRDLAVVEQAEPGRSKPADHYIETLLLQTGRPTLIVPYVHDKPAAFNHITVAWDGSAVAARALAASIPFLQHANQVDVISVETERLPADDARDERLVKHLARHGVDARARSIPSALSIADTILSGLADSGSDLLVMGAYGHSRLRERMLGGTTRSILQAMTAPVLLSH